MDTEMSLNDYSMLIDIDFLIVKIRNHLFYNVAIESATSKAGQKL